MRNSNRPMMKYMRCSLSGFFLLFGLVLMSSVAVGPDDGLAFDPHPLQPANTSSPRDTLQSFVRHFDASIEAWRHQEAEKRRRATARAAYAFDFSERPAHSRVIDAFQKMVLLKEVLDRVELPPHEQIPGAEQVGIGGSGLDRWRIPFTEIEIAKIEDGPRRGEFLFTKETIRRLDEYYALAKDLPYKEGAQADLYKELLASPGPLIPRQWIESLPAWAHTVVLGEGLWQWFALAFVLVVAASLIIGFYRLGRWWDDEFKRTNSWLCFGVPIALVGTMAVALFSREIVTEGIWLFGLTFQIVSFGIWTVVFGSAAWLVILMVGRLGDAFAHRQTTEKNLLRHALLPLVFRLIGVIVAAYIVVFAADFLGVPVAPLIAGLGVGGLAIGFGAQTLVRDILSGLFFLLDDALRVGEYIDVGSVKGRVEQISIRSLRLRHHNGPLHTIPFGEIQHLTNFSRDWVIMKLEVRVPFDTDLEEVRKIIKKVGQDLMADAVHGLNLLEPLKSQGVNRMDDSAFILRVKFMAKPGEQFMLRREVFRRIQEAFAANGIRFAPRRVIVDTGTVPPAAAAAAAAEMNKGE